MKNCRIDIILVFVFAQMASAANWFVATNGTGDGTNNWANATNSLQGAIDASFAADTVWVSNGVYETGGLTNYPAGGLLTNRVAIYKAITVRSANNDPGNTIIKGAQPSGATAVRCIYMTNGSSLIGFTLTNGATLTTNESANQIVDRGGGGAWCQSISPVISNCIITGNTSVRFAAGVFCGALFNCMLIGNVMNSESGIGTGGGGGAEDNGVGSLALYNCTLSGNWSTGSGGGVYGGVLYNCLVVGNKGYYGGGARPTAMFNCTVVGNSGTLGGGVFGNGTLCNCIIYSNSAPNCYDYGTFFAFTNCCTTPASTNSWATGNITNEPMFIANGDGGYGTNHVAGNYRLKADSPCVNAGLNQDWMTGAVDLDGRKRIRYGTVDIGAYECIYNGTVYSVH